MEWVVYLQEVFGSFWFGFFLFLIKNEEGRFKSRDA